MYNEPFFLRALRMAVALFSLVLLLHGTHRTVAELYELCPRVNCSDSATQTCDEDEDCAGKDGVRMCCSSRGCCAPALTLNVTVDPENGGCTSATGVLRTEGSNASMSSVSYSCDGRMFRPVQCASVSPSVSSDVEYCWCASREGEPQERDVYAAAAEGSDFTCTCNYNGKIQRAGDSFSSEDGCNMCFCSVTGNVGCTLRACDICLLEQEVGSCNQSIPAFYYNQTDKTCQKFEYGGCEGNGNRFETLGDCYGRCQCVGEPETGPCKAAFPRYYYDTQDMTCKSFTYGGCRGNRNRFESIEECNGKCRCSMEKDTGPCEAYFPSFYYDKEEMACKEFVYGGCQGNGNRFSSLAECNQQCLPGRCSQPPVSGLCLAYFPSFYYNSEDNRCDKFIYGGCGGNQNRFETLSDCYDQCGIESRCSLNYDSGPCEAATKRFYFDRESGECKGFLYGGCGGNKNNFVTEDRCEEVCEPKNYVQKPDCSLVKCAYPVCDYGIEPITAPDKCCPFCSYDFYSCPPVRRSDNCTSTQQPGCASDEECEDGKKCCRDGCGNSICTAPLPQPFHKPPLVCPQPKKDSLSTCVDECQFSGECEEGELCCPQACGFSACMEPDRPLSICHSLRERLNAATPATAASTELFVPECLDDGRFAPVQCIVLAGGKEKACFCVDVTFGEPLTEYSFEEPDCSGVGCKFNGMKYVVGEQFFAEDGCNQCTCNGNGSVECTEKDCEDTCTLPPAAGDCRGSFPAFYYDPDIEGCRSFTYSGCNGNQNKFKTLSDCIKRCAPSKECLQPAPKTSPCLSTGEEENDDDYGYFFNTSSHTCQFVYDVCENSDNFFEGLKECLKECDPANPGPIDSTGLHCLDIQCDAPVCKAGYELTSSDLYCCEYCVPTANCDDDEFQCVDGSCIDDEFVCDGLRDCENGEDEYNCEEKCEFQCNDGTCIKRSSVCNCFVDCREAEDERFCSSYGGVGLPYYQPPLVCPSSNDLLGDCTTTCTSNQDCREGYDEEQEEEEEREEEDSDRDDNDNDDLLCCSNTCQAYTCTKGVQLIDSTISLCLAVQKKAKAANTSIGTYVPQCGEEDGRFSAKQCWASTGMCWCVDKDTGRPTSNATRADIDCSSTCTSEDGRSFASGEVFADNDGCNTCFCCPKTKTVRCSKYRCAQAVCKVGDEEYQHKDTFQRGCQNCTCLYGELDCDRTSCTRTSRLTSSPLNSLSMSFNGDYDEIVKDLETFKRRMTQALLNRYQSTLGLVQQQIARIEVRRGSIVVIVYVDEATDATSGADLELLASQIESDYNDGILVVEYNGQQLLPNGEFSAQYDSSGLKGWQIALIVIAAILAVLVIIAVTACVVVAVMRCGRSSQKLKSKDDNEGGTYKGQDSDYLELKKPLT